MWIRKKLILSEALLFFWLFPSLYGSHAQAEAQYTISEMELTQLEQNLTTLEQHSKDKSILLDKQAKQIKKSQELNEQMQNSLEKANQYLKEYEREAERKIRIKARQRNMWIVISVVAVGAAIPRR